MKILVLSDSHSTLNFMRRCIDAVKPDTIVHLGDHYDDAEAMKEEYPRIPLYQVPGNCDKYRMRTFVPEILVVGQRLFMRRAWMNVLKWQCHLAQSVLLRIL